MTIAPGVTTTCRLRGSSLPMLLVALAATQVACMARARAPGGNPDASAADAPAAVRDARTMPDRSTSGTGGATGARADAGREICDNGLDDDGDGMVDDDCSCLVGTTEPCFPFAAGLAGVGACAAGVATCQPGDEIDRWSACRDARGPAAETCDGVDNDCDGVVDEDCACVVGDRRPCYPGPTATAGLGLCHAGTQLCVVDAGIARFADCAGAVLPAVEVCNGVDDDCNGVTDDGLVRSCGSSVGDCRAGMQTCAAGTWSACMGGVGPTAEDCNGGDENCDGTVDEGCTCVDGTRTACGTDTGACVAGTQLCAGGRYGPCTGAVNPIQETCNGVDDDCDGTVDNGCACLTGDSRACYAGPGGTAGVGACRAGTQRCLVAGGVASWSPCSGQVLPAVEACNNLDDDCNGRVDDGVTRACGSNVGDCRPGTQTCAAGLWGACAGGVTARTEDCNGGDENCDGVVDEGCSCVDGARLPCGTDAGACVAGSQLCVAGRFAACTGAIGPVTETCNDVDDDCDGVVDNGCICRRGDSRACYSGPTGTAGVGACRAGTQSCVIDAGLARWSVCAGEVLPGAESCNGIDDDCDGQSDDGVTRACGSSVGDCRPGTQTCSAGVFGPCAGGVAPTSEDCNGGDENCNGVVDEGCSCVDGTRIACGTDTGACVAGAQTCVGGKFGSCVGAVGPVPETCNGADDDCDGIVDNGCLCQRGDTRACYAGPAGTAGVGVCRSGTQACAIGAGLASWGACTGQVTPTPEVCNNLDDDCDAHVDDGVTRACGSSVGDCRPGTQTCVAGAFGACAGGVSPTAEDCNGGDENCDGVVDDGCSCLDGARIPCGTDTGACVAGTQTCAGGKFGACAGAVGSVAETCNDTDDDCNGVVDDGCVCRRGQTRGCYDGPPATSGLGICRAGTQACLIESGVARWGLCAGQVLPGAESCNGVDDDCDGVVDDGVTRACGSSVGDCRPGTQTCAAGVFGPCVGGVAAAATEDCNGGDENCNGVVDEGCACLDGAKIPCGSDTGACVAGTQTCVGGRFAACVGAIGPAAETCNGADDDCDGVVDDGFACTPGASQSCVTACQVAGTRTCSSGCALGPCLAAEVCNGCDDDGDGVVDDGFACARGAVQACSTACRTAGTRACSATCSGFSACVAAAETCGNACDDDGNGSADEGCCAAGDWALTVLDPVGHHHPDIALDGAGGVHIVYGDTPAQAAYRHLLAAGTQQVEIIDQSTGTLPAMFADAGGVIHAAFDDDTTAGQHVLRYSRRAGGGTWNAEAASNFDGDKAMVVDATGAVHIVFSERWVLPSRLHHLRRAPAGGWTDEVLAADVGSDPGLTIDASGLLHVVFSDAAAHQLRHGVRSAAGVWTFDTIDTIGGGHLSIQIDARGRIHVTVMQATISFHSTGRFRYYVRDGATWSAGEDIATGAWTTGLSDPSGGVPGEGATMTLDPAGTPYVAYYLVGSGDLRFAHRAGPGSWQSELIDASAGPLDGVTASIRASIAIDANLAVHVVFSRWDENQLVHGLRRCK